MDSGELYITLQLNAAEQNMNLLAQADPNDPLVQDAWRQIADIRQALKKRMTYMGTGLSVFTLMLFAAHGWFAFVWVPLLMILVFFFALYGFLTFTFTGNICAQTFAKMRWRQGADIHAMRVQSDADRIR